MRRQGREIFIRQRETPQSEGCEREGRQTNIKRKMRREVERQARKKYERRDRTDKQTWGWGV